VAHQWRQRGHQDAGGLAQRFAPAAPLTPPVVGHHPVVGTG
jgi:hypothetical protein